MFGMAVENREHYSTRRLFKLQFLKKPFLFAGKFFWRGNSHLNQQIAATRAPSADEPLTAQTKHLTGLDPGRDVNRDFAVQSFNPYLAAQGRQTETDIFFNQQIIAATLKSRIGFDANADVKVARPGAGFCRFALARKTERLSIINSRRHIDRNLSRLLAQAAAATAAAALGNSLAFAAAIRTGFLHPHHAKNRSLTTRHLSGAVAVFAGINL